MAFRAAPPSRATAAIAASAIVSLAPSPDARADYLDNVWRGRPEKLCPLVFGPGCRTTLSADLVLAHQPTKSDDNGNEPYLRSSLELALAGLVAPDLHLGPTIEFGTQDGRFMTGFHIVPKVRARYWIGGSPLSIDLALGGYFGRAWLDTGDAPRNRVGVQMDAGLGLLGALHFVGGFAALGEPTGVYGGQVQGFVGARVSLLTLLAALAFGLKR